MSRAIGVNFMAARMRRVHPLRGWQSAPDTAEKTFISRTLAALAATLSLCSDAVAQNTEPKVLNVYSLLVRSDVADWGMHSRRTASEAPESAFDRLLGVASTHSKPP